MTPITQILKPMRSQFPLQILMLFDELVDCWQQHLQTNMSLFCFVSMILNSSPDEVVGGTWRYLVLFAQSVPFATVWDLLNKRRGQGDVSFNKLPQIRPQHLVVLFLIFSYTLKFMCYLSLRNVWAGWNPNASRWGTCTWESGLCKLIIIEKGSSCRGLRHHQ